MKLALQTFTIRKAQKKDLFKALKKANEMGFNSFEMSRFDFDEKTLASLKKAKEELSISYLNFQKTFDSLNDSFDMVVRFCHELECPTVCISVLPLAYILKGEKEIKQFCDKANALYERYRQKGILLTYHTHDFEYINVDGYCAIDTIVKEIKTPLIVDCYWATRAGRHIETLLSRLRDKVYGIHIKDYNCTRNIIKRDCEPAALGQGVLDIGSIIRKSKELNLVYAAVEHHSNQPFTEMQISLNYLKEHHLLEEFE